MFNLSSDIRVSNINLIKSGYNFGVCVCVLTQSQKPEDLFYSKDSKHLKQLLKEIQYVNSIVSPEPVFFFFWNCIVVFPPEMYENII